MGMLYNPKKSWEKNKKRESPRSTHTKRSGVFSEKPHCHFILARKRSLTPLSLSVRVILFSYYGLFKFKYRRSGHKRRGLRSYRLWAGFLFTPRLLGRVKRLTDYRKTWQIKVRFRVASLPFQNGRIIVHITNMSRVPASPHHTTGHLFCNVCSCLPPVYVVFAICGVSPAYLFTWALNCSRDCILARTIFEDLKELL